MTKKENLKVTNVSKFQSSSSENLDFVERESNDSEEQITVQLVNESCFSYLKKLKSGSVDLVLIDAPYEISKDTNFQSGEKTGKDTDRFRVSMDFGKWDSDFTGLDKVILECYRVLRKGGTLICFYDLWKLTTLKEYFEQAKFKQLRFIEWQKTNPVPLNSKVNYLSNAREIAVSGVKVGRGTFNSEYDAGIYKYPICHDKGRFHPTQKPVALIEEMINKHSKENDVVLDCFSGSGTTAVACIRTGRNFIGCELDKYYYDKSIDRLKSLGCDFDLFTSMEGGN